MRNNKLPKTDKMIIYDRIIHLCRTFAGITFSNDKAKRGRIMEAANQIMFKMSKVVDELHCFNNNLHAANCELLKATARGVSAVPTHDLGKNIENFLTQAKGVLDIFAKQFLSETISYDGKWDSNKIIKHLKGNILFDSDIKKEIINLLEEENTEWIQTFIDDRNLCHDKNISLSLMHIENGKPRLTLKRSNDDVIYDIVNFLQSHYNKLFNLIEVLIRYSFCILNPGYKDIYLSKLRSVFADMPNDALN